MKHSQLHFKEDASWSCVKSNHICSSLTGKLRKKTQCMLVCFCAILATWICGVVLSFLLQDGVFNDIKIIGSNRRYSNIFEEFNSQLALRHRGFDFEEYDDIKIGGKRSAQEMYAPKKRMNKKNTSVENMLNNLRFSPDVFLPSADCSRIINGDVDAIEQTKLLTLEMRSKVFEEKRKQLEAFDETLMKMTLNCTNFIQNRKYVTSPMTVEEKSYPIAYIITVHKKFSIFERLLRSIYHPQNIYCIHVDKKSSSHFIDGIRNLSSCFPNVFVASTLSEVHYSHWSRVQADLNCFSDLVKKKLEVPWKYVINLCGQDFPLQTNLEVTRVLKSLHGYNNIESIISPAHKKKRFEFHFVLPSDKGNQYALVEKTNIQKEASPLETSMFSGSAYYIWKRQAIEFMLVDPTIQKFFKWNEDTFSPDEHLWATLQRWYPRMPGSFPPHQKYDVNELQTVTRLVKWGGLDGVVYPKCAGQYRRGVCVYGVGDLPWLVQQHHLFANKFDYDVDPFAINCLDIWLRNKTISQAIRYIRNGYF